MKNSITTPRVGDFAILRVRVTGVDDAAPSFPVEVDIEALGVRSQTAAWVMRSAIVGYERDLEVGDSVVSKVGGGVGEIRAIDGDAAWVKYGESVYASLTLSSLRRA